MLLNLFEYVHIGVAIGDREEFYAKVINAVKVVVSDQDECDEVANMIFQDLFIDFSQKGVDSITRDMHDKLMAFDRMPVAYVTEFCLQKVNKMRDGNREAKRMRLC